MGSEETELTFMRCPSCRSLVPSVAARCRMCGHVFEGDADDSGRESLDQLKKKSRVRQRTISVSREEVESYTKSIIEGDKDLQIPFDGEEAKIPAVEEEVGFLEPGQTEGSEGFTENEAAMPVTDQSADQVAVAADDWFEQVEHGQSMEAYTAVPEDSVLPEAGSPEASFPAVDDDSLTEANDVQDLAPVDMAEIPVEEIGVVDYSATEEEEPHKVDIAQANQPQVEIEAELVEEVASIEESKIEPNIEPDIEQDVALSEPAPVQAEEKSPRQEEGVLVGWFVSSGSDNKGVAIEIRSGQCFLGRQQLRGHDLVVDDPSVSTPHCMMAASVNDGVKIQDLMSENGTYYRKKGTAEFVAARNAIIPEHGDAVRFGSFEALVCLIPRDNQGEDR